MTNVDRAVPEKARGRVELVGGLLSPQEHCLRAVRVYLPANYESEKQTYGLLVLQDGQNVFAKDREENALSWDLQHTLDLLSHTEKLEPWIVVGVEHRGIHRIADYSPWADGRLSFVPHGERYGQFIVETLLPWLRSRYRVRTEAAFTAAGGSSLGGLFSLYLSWKFPEIFGRTLALSPSTMWGDGSLARYWSLHTGTPSRIYLDVGSRERFLTEDFVLEYGIEVRAFAQHLRYLGYGEDELKLVLDPRGQHTEASWARRMPAALRWLWGERS